MNNYRIYRRNATFNYQEIGVLALNITPRIDEYIFFDGSTYQIENIEHLGAPGQMITNLYCNVVNGFKK
ncbi:MAG: hypothetical protein H8E98_03860 [Bacteroidetes bacterium]|nr:hypothetical protein [Bacteroidota bacterium]